MMNLPMCTMLSTKNNENIQILLLLLTASIKISAKPSFMDFVTFPEITTANILVEDQLWPPLDMVTPDLE